MERHGSWRRESEERAGGRVAFRASLMSICVPKISVAWRPWVSGLANHTAAIPLLWFDFQA